METSFLPHPQPTLLPTALPTQSSLSPVWLQSTSFPGKGAPGFSSGPSLRGGFLGAQNLAWGLDSADRPDGHAASSRGELAWRGEGWPRNPFGPHCGFHQRNKGSQWGKCAQPGTEAEVSSLGSTRCVAVVVPQETPKCTLEDRGQTWGTSSSGNARPAVSQECSWAQMWVPLGTKCQQEPNGKRAQGADKEREQFLS